MTALGKVGVALTAKLASSALSTAVVPHAPAATEPVVDGRPGPPRSTEPVVIAHRGASGHRPEHTLAAYRLAIAMGADYVEPDLVATKDGVLVARHENEISGTTDVAERPEFADRRTTKTIDGQEVTGWFTEDFTLRELRTLRAVERLPEVRPDNTAYDGRYRIPTFDEVLRLVRQESRRRHRPIGVYPETKHPTYFDSIGLSLEEPLVRTLRRHHLDRPDARVLVQSFETGNLRALDRMTQVPLVQLVGSSGAPYDLVADGDPRTYRDLVTRAGLAWIAQYADGIGAEKTLVLPRDASGATTTPSTLVDDAHAERLFVHVWTLRNENRFLPTNHQRGDDPDAWGDALAEARDHLDTGVDGFFTDYPDTGVEARDDWLPARAG